ncbi:hypothetical protein BLD25_03500 [Candidatus Gracilibacteria bacterium GN02-872]|nr:hypothetical protein BLD25_03500 [Candidatus Gracilibacteria bacterium GN02-872]
MFGFEYRYTESFEIFKNIKKFLDYGITEWIFLSVGIIFIFSMTFYVIPKIKIYLKQSLKEKERNEKKKLINKIVLQKNLEDLVMREVNEKR